MKLKLTKVRLSLLLVFVSFLGTGIASVSAQNSSTSWTQCTDGRMIVRCESYDCPSGDTNRDGKCTTADTNARLTDARNDSFCANPLSGCGEVRYFASNDSNTCSVRVEETENNCDLYAAANPNFTPRPSSSPIPSSTPQSGVSQCISLSASPFEGAAPLKVNFQGEARDPKGTIAEYQFEFKGPTATVGTIAQRTSKVTQTFDKPGEYTAKLTIVDSTGKTVTSLGCQTTITVREATTKGGGDSETKLPETGSEVWVGIILIALGGAGAYMYERFRVV